jgi:hypothetical protein
MVSASVVTDYFGMARQKSIASAVLALRRSLAYAWPLAPRCG